jgi:NAD(P)-dependent dehydrogenase (short-subunit alcohol dehydrogenase family)
MYGRAFSATSTTDDVLAGVDLSGQRILVTGVSAGLGVETARTLVAHGAQVVGAARDLAKAQRATEQVRAQAAKSARLELVELDLASLASVRACADALVAQGKPFDLVIANAGVMACPFGHTEDGFEIQFGTNHVGHFVLVNRVSSLMRPGARLVNLSSSGHRYADVDLTDPNFERTPYAEFVAYGRSKTANILFAVEFDRRHRARGVRATAVHPGGIHTELGRYAYSQPGALERRLDEINAAHAAVGKPPLHLKSIQQGAATSVWAGVVAGAEEVGGRYCEDCHVAELLEGEDTCAISEGVRPYALDPERAKALWAKSEDMVAERF